ncbi:MAG: hypothetical protein IKJ39_06075 [Lachnospiraceae bacterium]|nr:hypothetical protein [Lachnospiraceae bacterium]
MSVQQKNEKQPMSQAAIYRLMLILVFGVSALFFLKNVFSKDMVAIIVIGICLVVFAIAVIVLEKMKTAMVIRQSFVSMSIIGVVFIISLFSGKSFSDDFCLYLAVIGLAGMYFKPKLALLQLGVADVALILAAIIRPEKTGGIGQYILCMAMFNLAGVLIYLVIKRGRAYIAKSDRRAEEAEKLIASIKNIGEEIHKNLVKSSEAYEGLNAINKQLEHTAEGLRMGSESIIAGTDEVVDVCDDMRQKIVMTGNHINSLNNDVNQFESALSENHKNMEDMTTKMVYVKKSMQVTSQVFQQLEDRMRQITEVTDQLNKIASNTNMLALNASIEAARAGKMGEGFAVVASKVQELAVDSNRCSSQVAVVVKAIMKQLKDTTAEIEESEEAIQSSLDALEELEEGRNQLNSGFASLYMNIGAQNDNVGAIDREFEQLKNKVSAMSMFTQVNQRSVESITEAIAAYKVNMQKVIDDSTHISSVSQEMLATVMEIDTGRE